ncbi:T9SS type A sorting domain-containing protein [Aquimarina sp. U1-2]|uniref:T9SS type A sorting domain-containing protein n=1 Tax=Aquimarina sp. U1-2 TaxID=2823141 RepID=UPI001AEC799E|nr:T9SS type A sorting domain-containing protein [Aquimarina sp. U1-2]MBP2831425.1 T9SS type A sorting domain-containing protein [Aquimarina sp. U1-2]
MRKIYLLFIFVGLICFSFTTGIQAQISAYTNTKTKSQEDIAGLQVYQSPATRDVLYITSDSQHTKTVRIFNVLGKLMLFKVLIGKELDISTFPPGVYILKVTEDKTHQKTLKLILE